MINNCIILVYIAILIKNTFQMYMSDRKLNGYIIKNIILITFLGTIFLKIIDFQYAYLVVVIDFFVSYLIKHYMK